MTLRHRLDRLAAHSPPPREVVSAEDAIAKICVVSSDTRRPRSARHTRIPYDRLAAVLDRLTAVGWNIPDRAGEPRAARLAAALGWTLAEGRAALQARMRGEAWCGSPGG